MAGLLLIAIWRIRVSGKIDCCAIEASYQDKG
jgi:hypothetical protein